MVRLKKRHSKEVIKLIDVDIEKILISMSLTIVKTKKTCTIFHKI